MNNATVVSTAQTKPLTTKDSRTMPTFAAPLFTATVRAEAFFKGHALNIDTYVLVTAVLLLQGAEALLEFIKAHYDRRDEYTLQIQIAKLKAKRFFIRIARTVAEFAAYHGFAAKAATAAKFINRIWSKRSAIAQQALDKVFCLG